jgi:hypothetical protein
MVSPPSRTRADARQNDASLHKLHEPLTETWAGGHGELTLGYLISPVSWVTGDLTGVPLYVAPVDSSLHFDTRMII